MLFTADRTHNLKSANASPLPTEQSLSISFVRRLLTEQTRKGGLSFCTCKALSVLVEWLLSTTEHHLMHNSVLKKIADSFAVFLFYFYTPACNPRWAVVSYSALQNLNRTNSNINLRSINNVMGSIRKKNLYD